MIEGPGVGVCYRPYGAEEKAILYKSMHEANQDGMNNRGGEEMPFTKVTIKIKIITSRKTELL